MTWIDLKEKQPPIPTKWLADGPRVLVWVPRGGSVKKGYWTVAFQSFREDSLGDRRDPIWRTHDYHAIEPSHWQPVEGPP